MVDMGEFRARDGQDEVSTKGEDQRLSSRDVDTGLLNATATAMVESSMV